MVMEGIKRAFGCRDHLDIEALEQSAGAISGLGQTFGNAVIKRIGIGWPQPLLQIEQSR